MSDLGSDEVDESRAVEVLVAASTDLLREPPLLETRCRFLAEGSWSLNGFGRVEQGSEEAPRSRDDSGESRSIW